MEQGNPTSLSRDASFASLSIMLPLAKSPIKPFCTSAACRMRHGEDERRPTGRPSPLGACFGLLWK